MFTPYVCNSHVCNGTRHFLPEKGEPCPRCGNVELEQLEIIHLLVPDPQGLVGKPPHRIACQPTKFPTLPPYYTDNPRACTCTDCLPSLLEPAQPPPEQSAPEPTCC